MKKDTTQPPTEKPVKTDLLESIFPEHALKVTDKKEATILIFDDEYVSMSYNTPTTKKTLKVGDRVKNAIKAMLKEGYAVKVQTISQTEIPF